MEPALRTPEGEPNRCPICGHRVRIEPSRPPGDATCPYCGHLLWFADLRNVEGEASGRGQTAQPGTVTKAAANPSLAEWAKEILVAAVLGLAVGAVPAGVSAGDPDVSVAARMFMVGATCVVVMLAALGLALRDVLRHRLQQGQQVNWILRLYFASGWMTMAVWLATAIAMPFVVAGCLALVSVIDHLISHGVLWSR